MDKRIEKTFFDIKRNYPGALILFRLGNFYELFHDDARLASSILGIPTTRRGKVLSAIFPNHALDGYLPKLIGAKLRVAICERLEEPKAAHKDVKQATFEFDYQ